MRNKAYSLIRYAGEAPIFVRLESGDAKVECEKDDIHFAEASRANHLCAGFRFEPILPIDITPEMLKKAQIGLKEKAERQKEALIAQAQTRKDEIKRREQRKGVEKKLRALKHAYNLNEITLEAYEKKKAKIEEAHSKEIGAAVEEKKETPVKVEEKKSVFVPSKK